MLLCKLGLSVAASVVFVCLFVFVFKIGILSYLEVRERIKKVEVRESIRKFPKQFSILWTRFMRRCTCHAYLSLSLILRCQ